MTKEVKQFFKQIESGQDVGLLSKLRAIADSRQRYDEVPESKDQVVSLLKRIENFLTAADQSEATAAVQKVRRRIQRMSGRAWKAR